MEIRRIRIELTAYWQDEEGDEMRKVMSYNFFCEPTISGIAQCLRDLAEYRKKLKKEAKKGHEISGCMAYYVGDILYRVESPSYDQDDETVFFWDEQLGRIARIPVSLEGLEQFEAMANEFHAAEVAKYSE